MRFILSCVIIVLLFVYVISPAYKYIVKFVKKESSRTLNNFNIDKKNDSGGKNGSKEY